MPVGICKTTGGETLKSHLHRMETKERERGSKTQADVVMIHKCHDRIKNKSLKVSVK